MSETTVRGFQMMPGVLDEHLGSCSEELVGSILLNQKDLIDECDRRLQNSYFEDRQPLNAVSALRALIFGNLLDEQVLEGASALEALIVELGQPLEDSSDNHSLWNNQYFWLDDFETIFELLGLDTLQTVWQSFSFPLSPRGEHPEWPIWSLIEGETLRRCANDFDNLHIDEAIESLSPELFTAKMQDEDPEELQSIMADNLHTLFEWISICNRNESQLILLFDGDI